MTMSLWVQEVECGGLDEICSFRLMYLDTWLLVGNPGSFFGEQVMEPLLGRAFLGEVYC